MGRWRATVKGKEFDFDTEADRDAFQAAADKTIDRKSEIMYDPAHVVFDPEEDVKEGMWGFFRSHVPGSGLRGPALDWFFSRLIRKFRRDGVLYYTAGSSGPTPGYAAFVPLEKYMAHVTEKRLTAFISPELTAWEHVSQRGTHPRNLTHLKDHSCVWFTLEPTVEKKVAGYIGTMGWFFNNNGARMYGRLEKVSHNPMGEPFVSEGRTWSDFVTDAPAPVPAPAVPTAWEQIRHYGYMPSDFGHREFDGSCAFHSNDPVDIEIAREHIGKEVVAFDGDARTSGLLDGVEDNQDGHPYKVGKRWYSEIVTEGARKVNSIPFKPELMPASKALIWFGPEDIKDADKFLREYVAFEDEDGRTRQGKLKKIDKTSLQGPYYFVEGRGWVNRIGVGQELMPRDNRTYWDYLLGGWTPQQIEAERVCGADGSCCRYDHTDAAHLEVLAFDGLKVIAFDDKGRRDIGSLERIQPDIATRRCYGVNDHWWPYIYVERPAPGTPS